MGSKKIQIQPQVHSPAKHLPRFKRIIIIDDSDVDLFINETILKAVALSSEINRSVEARTVLEELKNAQRLSEVPELIFLDLQMKDMDGFEFLREFAGLSDFVRNKCKIVVVTSSESKDDKYQSLMNPSVIRYLLKPLDVYQLKDFMYT